MPDLPSVLQSLLTLDRPLEAVLEDLHAFPWVEEELVLLKNGHVAEVLRRFLSGSMSAGEVETWANAIEGRDAIELPEGELDLAATIHELANPFLTETLTEKRAAQLLRNLS